MPPAPRPGAVPAVAPKPARVVGTAVVGEKTGTGPILLLVVLGGVLVAIAVVWVADSTSRAGARR